MVVQHLEVQPAYVFTAHVFSAEARFVGRNQHRFNSARRDQQGLLAYPLQADEPKGRGVDAVAAGSEQPMILVDRGLHALERAGHRSAGLGADRHLARLLGDHHMVFKKYRRVLGYRLYRAAQRGKGRTVDRVRMAHGDDVRVLLMAGGVQHKAGAVDRVGALHHPALVVRQNQVA